MIRLGDVNPALRELRDRLAVETIQADDLPAAYVRALYGLPDTAPVSSRVDQLWHANNRRTA